MRDQIIVTAAVGVILSSLSGCGASVKVQTPVVATPAVAVEYNGVVRPMKAEKQLIHSGANEGMCFNVVDDNASQHASVKLHPCNGRENQRWSFGPGVAGAVQVGSIGGLCLDVPGNPSPNGSYTQLMTCNGSPTQEYKFYADGRIRELATNKCLGAGGGADHLGIVPEVCSITNLAQVWTVADH
jgi:hypothetical protein